MLVRVGDAHRCSVDTNIGSVAINNAAAHGTYLSMEA